MNKKPYAIGERLAGDHRDERTGEWKRVRGKFQGTTLAGSITIDGRACAPNSVRRLKIVQRPKLSATVKSARVEQFRAGGLFGATGLTVESTIEITTGGATTLRPGDTITISRAAL
jgi:hypothetical protein